MEQNFKIRNMVMEDLDGVLAIENLSFFNPWSRYVFLRELQIPISRNLVATVCKALRDEIAGYVTYWVIAGELEVHKICVRADLRKSGVASMLMAEMIRLSCCEGLSLCTLEVGKSNEGAKRLYEKFGFQVTDIRRRYYTESCEDAMILCANLKKCLQFITKA
ncbi:MAG TPA: ribosomal protein S18-alanine N-acetyltransferase [Syntrophales bacterium]|nr:ribosomal protein S18-alanine N-acetyltransferase [Syntrophales bacterium]